MPVLVPTLSVHGNVQSPVMSLSVLLSDALTTYKSQSWMFVEDTTSIPYLVNQYSTKPDTLVSLLQNQLQTYFEKYFKEGVAVNVEHDSTPDNPRYTLTVGIHAIVDGVPYSVGDSYNVADSAITKVVNAFNGE